MRFMRHASWDDTLFIHYPVSASALQQRLPPDLEVDTHKGIAYIGIVVLTESGIAPWPPGMPLLFARMAGLSHHAVNVRTYVRPKDNIGPPGIFFFSLDCSALLPTLGASALFNLPYRYAHMQRSSHDDGASGTSMRRQRFESQRVVRSEDGTAPEAFLDAEWVVEEQEQDEEPTALSSFLVERYALYNPTGPLMRLFRIARTALWGGTITHEPWPMRRASLVSLRASVVQAAGLGDLLVGDDGDAPPAPVVHSSRGVGPIAFFWNGEF